MLSHRGARLAVAMLALALMREIGSMEARTDEAAASKLR
jgi:hypothetical protein